MLDASRAADRQNRIDVANISGTYSSQVAQINQTGQNYRTLVQSLPSGVRSQTALAELTNKHGLASDAGTAGKAFLSGSTAAWSIWDSISGSVGRIASTLTGGK